MKGTAFVLAVAIGALAAAPAPAEANSPHVATQPAARVRDGLAANMAQAADALRRSERYDATRALNRARHLAGAMATAAQVASADAPVFRSAYEAIDEGRHALQDGEPDRASEILESGAAALRAARITGRDAPLDARSVARAPGYNVIDESGRKRGELQALELGNAAARLQPSAGGAAGFGAHRESVEADGVYLGKNYLVATLGGRDSTKRR
jgi:hypothetical protein